ncbi:hypothetical protein [Leptolyngbya sp. FACHB-711]|uniref:hypothetical protein n=1 Tax=Leptolyngbya sp. FACHB-711 TaxID=2692813 RepID=UPI001A7E3FB6|nr:hypothetical protein [Leptolyngbya sp. FACHB-711]
MEKELSPNEQIQWIEQPIARFFTRSVLGVCLVLFVSLLFFSFTSFSTYQQARGMGRSLLEFVGVPGALVFLMGTVIPLFLIFFIPFLNWLTARQSVYVITYERAFILTAGRSTTVTSFMPSELRVVSRREDRDGSGDIILYVHRSKDYDGDIQTQEIGFKQVRNAKAFERMLRQIDLG